MHSAFRRIALAALFPLLFLLPACSGESHPLAYLSGALSFTAQIPLGEEMLVAEVSLSAAEGAERDGTVRILSPSSLAGAIFRKENGAVTVSYGKHSLSLSSAEGTPLAYLELLSIRMPLDRVRRENGERIYLFSEGESRHTVAVRDGERLPYRIALQTEEGVRTMEITP